ncbi:MAG TPA: hypothetical protein PKM97_10890 [Bacteroidia bacterium]|nr:hypothetical protein [Bacteroidia bacterium]
MKKLFVCICSLLLVLVLPGCDGPKKSNTQSNPAKEEAAAESPVEAATPNAESEVPNDEGMAENQNLEREKKMSEVFTGAGIIESLMGNLTEKLALSGTQTSDIKNVISGTFTSLGYSSDKEYSFELAKSMKQDILKNSSNQILAVLDANQKEKFGKFMNK